MAIRPAKFLIVDFALGSATSVVPNGVWAGYPYQWEATLTVTAQPHGSDETTPTAFYYDGNNVNVGDYVATSGKGAIVRIVSISYQDGGTVNCVVEDWNHENIYQDDLQSGAGAIPDGEGYLFEVVDGIPVLHPLPDALSGAIPPYFASSVLTRFFRNKSHTEVEATQAAHGLAVGDAIYLGSDGNYVKAKADAAGTATVIGIVTQIGVPDANRFRFRPVGPLVTGISMPVGVPGSIVYLSDSTAGGLTLVPPVENVVKVFIKVSDTSGILFGGGGSSGGGGAGADRMSLIIPDMLPSGWPGMGALYAASGSGVGSWDTTTRVVSFDLDTSRPVGGEVYHLPFGWTATWDSENRAIEVNHGLTNSAAVGVFVMPMVAPANSPYVPFAAPYYMISDQKAAMGPYGDAVVQVTMDRTYEVYVPKDSEDLLVDPITTFQIRSVSHDKVRFLVIMTDLDV